MTVLISMKSELDDSGFIILPGIYSNTEVEGIKFTIQKADSSQPTFRRSSELFAIRQFLKEIPDVRPLLFNDKLNAVLSEILGNDFFLVKSIYFDKPGNSNWFVAYHQDLTISVDKKVPIEGYSAWTVRHNQYSVQPPVTLLEHNFTVRIHLDDTDEANGALKVVPRSHHQGLTRPENIDWEQESEISCSVPKGGIMIMKPLLLHASGKSFSKNNRRVIHLEFSNQELPGPLQWSEQLQYR